jgi:transcriptional regulator with XRE-family HTH domain
LRDVAEEAGVSINTASRALNNKPEISPKTKAMPSFQPLCSILLNPSAKLSLNTSLLTD